MNWNIANACLAWANVLLALLLNHPLCALCAFITMLCSLAAHRARGSESRWLAWSTTAAVFAALMLGASIANAQWGAACRGAVAPLVVRQQPSKLEWIKDRSAPGQIDLVRDGWKLVGAYCPETGIYLRLIDYRKQLWSEPEPLPDNVPLPPGGVIEQVVENFGVDLDKLHAEKDGYKIGGRVVSKEEAYEAIEKGLPDDAHKMRVTVIGDDEHRKRFEQTFRASDLAGSCVLWSVPPDHWSLKDNDTKTTVFKVDGKPTIYAQAPDGKVLWRQDDDAGAIENLRKVNKPYDPKKDPGPSSGSADGILDALKQVSPQWWALAGLAALIFFTRGKNGA